MKYTTAGCACLAIGALSLSSLLFWGFTGMPLWAPLGDGEIMRGAVLGFLHIVGVILGIVGVVAGLDE